MANWLIVLDEDDRRREAYVRVLKGSINPIEGLNIDSLQGDTWDAVWAAATNAPVDANRSPEGAAIVWGEARSSDGELQTSEAIRNAWHTGASAQWDGYYSAAVVDESRRSVIVGTDILGIFPVYYWSDGRGVALIGASPELFKDHPSFRAELNVKGLIGILLTNGLVNGECLWKGVKRLSPGQRLRVDNGQISEDVGYSMPVNRESYELPFNAHVDQLYDSLTQSVSTQTTGNVDYGLLLSGGLDSRMVLGFLIQAGIRPKALTQGLPNDLEMRCAQAVANVYGIEHSMIEPNASDYPAVSQLTADWEHLAGGFTNIREWWTQGRLSALGDRIVTGGMADSQVGGVCQGWTYSEENGNVSYDNYFAQMQNLGIFPEVVKQLFKAPEHKQLVDEVAESLRNEFYAYGDSVPYCAWRYDLAHGQRFHVGGVLWRLSFGAWPVLPMLHRSIIDTVTSMPSATIADRELQIAMVRDKFPEMANAPLDRSDLLSVDPQYLAPEAKEMLSISLRNLLRGPREIMQKIRPSEHRYWFRVNNFNGELWRQARQSIDSEKDNVASLLDVDFLNTVIPSPLLKYHPEGPWVGESGRKLLLGFLYWARTHLE